MSQAGKRKEASHSAGPSSSQAKRVRINDPGADETDFFDGDPELDTVGRTRRQRNSRITQHDMGAESSDDDDSDAGEPERQKDEDQDMFDVAPSDDDTAKGKGKANGKTKFLSLGELDVGQEFDSTKRAALDDPTADAESAGEEADPDLELEDTESESEDSDPIDLNAHGERTPPTSPGGTPLARAATASRRKWTRAKGPKITGFNIKEEMKTGQFDTDGNYHERQRDPQAQHDAWLSGVYSKNKIRAARLAHEKREREAAQVERLAQHTDGDEDQIRKDLTEHMLRQETVQRTLQRLGKRATELRKLKATNSQSAEEWKSAAKQVETVTHLSSVLMSRFDQLDVYDETYESLLETVRKSGLVRQTFDPAARFDEQTAPSPSVDDDAWEYKWAPAYLAETAREAGTSVPPEVEVFGAFSRADLATWADEGYFGTHRERILLRPASSQDPWLPFPDLFPA